MNRPSYLTISHLRIALGLTWYLFERYLDLDVIPVPDAVAGNRPLWLMSNIESIRERIAQYERTKSAAKHNAL